MGLSLEEQEVNINATRDSETAVMYCSDSTWITKMDKLVRKSPDLFKVVAETDVGKTYSFPKRLLTIRSNIRKLSDEQKQAAAERMKNIHARS